MNRKPNLVQLMWLFFAAQIIIALGVTAIALASATTVLHAANRTDQLYTILTPLIRSNLQKEKDPVKLRIEANGLLQEVVDDVAYREWCSLFLIKVFAIYGVGLLVYSLGSGICAYNLRRLKPEIDFSTP